MENYNTKTIIEDVIEDINDVTLLSLDENLELDQESTEITEAKVKKEEEEAEKDMEDADDMDEAYKKKMSEEEISSDKEFMEYSKAILKAAHGDKYDEEKAMETAKGILDKAKGDYGTAVGMLTGGLGEDIKEDVSLKEAKLTKVDDDEYEMELNVKPRWDRLWSQDAENPNDPRPFIKTIIVDIKKLDDDYQFHAFVAALVKQIKTEAANDNHYSTDALNDFNKALAKAAAAFAQNGDLEEPDYNIKPYIAKIIGKIDQISLGYQFGVFLESLVKHAKSISGESKAYKQFYADLSKAYSKFDKEVNEGVELKEGSMDIAAIAKKLGLSDAEVNKLETQSAKQYSKGKGQTMLVDILKSVDNMSGPFRKAGMHYAKTGQFGMLDMIVNDRDEDMDEDVKEEVKEDTQSEITVDSSDIARLVESEIGLTEEFKEKATLIFETSVKSKIKEIEETLKESYAVTLIEEVESIKETFIDKIDNYLTYVVESWVVENTVAIESSLRTEIAENFIRSLKAVFVENYIEVPEAKNDLVAEMEEKISALQTEAAVSSELVTTLSEHVKSLTRETILADASSDLADTQAAKLKSLVEDIEFSSENSFRKKVGTIKEFYLKGILEAETLNELTDSEDTITTTETIVENETIAEEHVSPAMQKYLTALSRLNKATEATVTRQQ